MFLLYPLHILLIVDSLNRITFEYKFVLFLIDIVLFYELSRVWRIGSLFQYQDNDVRKELPQFQ